MDSLQSLKTQLLDFLATETLPPALSQISQYQVRVKTLADFSPLAWLKAQACYPHFYFHQREQKKQLIALGEVRRFEDLAQAQQFVKNTNYPLLGGLQFYGQCQFWLPRLLLEVEEQQLSLRLFLDLQKPLAEEKAQILALLKTFEKSTALLPVQQPVQALAQAADQQQWQQWVEKALAQIALGALTKVVLANKSSFQTPAPISALDLLAESERQNQHCYHFFLAENAEQAFLGSSPERLYARQGLQLESEALAGTAIISADVNANQQQADWLLQDKKNRYENWLVGQDIEQNLQPYAQHIQQGKLAIKALRQVQHLYCPIQAVLKPSSQDQDCLNAIHPTAAVAGLPRQHAKDFLQQTESFDRRWYAGSLGWMSAEQSEFCVAIRSALVEQNQIHIFAGAGIVEGSIPLLEWQEIERKALGLLSLLVKT